MVNLIIKLMLFPFLLTGNNMATISSNKKINAGYKKIIISNPVGGNLSISIWYPSADNEKTYTYNTAANQIPITGKVAFNGSIAAKNYPWIVFSHGFSGSGIGSVEICEALARNGYIVASPDHSDAVQCARIEGFSSGNLKAAIQHLKNNPFNNGTKYLYRIAEIKTVIDHLHTNDFFSVHPENLILGGHSMGGWTVLKALENNYHPKAMFFFSMGELNWLFQQQRYFDASFFQSLNFPTAYFYGAKEHKQAIAAKRENVYAAFCYSNSPSPSYGLIVPRGNHFSYNSKALAPQLSGNKNQNNVIERRLINFLDKHIKGKKVNVSNHPLDVSK